MVDLQTQGANRIANGTFELDGQEHQLDQNNGSHHLHGGGLPVDSNLRGGHEAKHLFKHQTVFLGRSWIFDFLQWSCEVSVATFSI